MYLRHWLPKRHWLLWQKPPQLPLPALFLALRRSIHPCSFPLLIRSVYPEHTEAERAATLSEDRKCKTKQQHRVGAGLPISKPRQSNATHGHTKRRATQKPMTEREKTNKQTKPYVLCYFSFFSISLKTGEFKLESELCLWVSQSWTAVWNERKRICCLVRLHVSLWIHERYYGIYSVMLARKSICVFVKGSPVLCWSCQHPRDFWSSACTLDSLL